MDVLALYLGIIVLIVGVWVYRVRRRTEHVAAVTVIAEARDWTYIPEYWRQEGDIETSFLASYDSVLRINERVNGRQGGVPIEIFGGSVDRLLHGYVQRLTVVKLKFHGVLPHVFITPKARPLLKRVDLSNERSLRPLELEGSGLVAYVPEGYEVEALQVLEPDTLEKLRDLGASVELVGLDMYVYFRQRFEAKVLERDAELAMRLGEAVKGLARIKRVGNKSPVLESSPLLDKIANQTFMDVYGWVATTVMYALCVVAVALLILNWS